MATKAEPLITHPEARRIHKTVIAALRRDGRLDNSTRRLADDLALLEEVKQNLMADIKSRGVVEWFTNGKQEMWRENKSVAAVYKAVEQQRKLQAELRLTPASGLRPDGARELDEFERF